jgi:LPS export ABC transporter protein LptC
MMWLSARGILLRSGPGWLLLLLLSTSPAAPQGPANGPPEVTLQSVHMLETRGGSRLWEVRADRAEVYEREGYTVLTRLTRPVQVVLFSSQGQLTCEANRATLDLRTKDVRLEGAVQAWSDQGTELRTESLKWTAASRRLQTDAPVSIRRGSLQSHGRGLEAETGLERLRIFRNITSQLGPGQAAGRSVVR